MTGLEIEGSSNQEEQISELEPGLAPVLTDEQVRIYLRRCRPFPGTE